MKGYLRFKNWVHSDQLTVGDNSLTSYGRVEIIALSIGLAMRELWINQFQENVSNIPPHVTNSPLEFREYEQLSYAAKDLISGYDEVYATIFCTLLTMSLMILTDWSTSTLSIRRILPTGR